MRHLLVGTRKWPPRRCWEDVPAAELAATEAEVAALQASRTKKQQKQERKAEQKALKAKAKEEARILAEGGKLQIELKPLSPVPRRLLSP